MHGLSLGFEEALRLVLSAIRPLPAEDVPLLHGVGRVAAADLRAKVDSPCHPTSRKDGFALRGLDAALASPQRPARLGLAGSLAAGQGEAAPLRPGQALRVLTGAMIPAGADTVVADEYALAQGHEVLVETLADSAKNILPAGGDVAQGQLLVPAGQSIGPVAAGLLAAAGLHSVSVFARPRVGIVGTGDEVVMPGHALQNGQLYASNLVTLAGFCRQYGLESELAIVGDEPRAMLEAFHAMAGKCDALITSGGAWHGERDLVAGVLDDLGWDMAFHRLRMGPGKATGFGLLGEKPVFVLPGGPPSNLMGFLQIALPGLLALCGRAGEGLAHCRACLAEDLANGDQGWSDFFQGRLTPGPDLPLFQPLAKRSRLSALAGANAVALIPEGLERLEKGSVLNVQLLGPRI